MLLMRYSLQVMFTYFHNGYVQDHKTPIFDAIRNGNYDAVQMLISHGARTDILDKVIVSKKFMLLQQQDGKSPLHYACASLSSRGPNVSLIMQLLVEMFHVDVNTVDKVQPASIVVHTYTMIMYTCRTTRLQYSMQL